MCGIHVSISPSRPADISPDLKRCLCSRGPDHTATRETRLGDDNEDAPATHLAFTSTVLALRGDHIARQPLVDPEGGSVLCWNGEAWRIGGSDLRSGNDGEVIADLLKEPSNSVEERQEVILGVLRSISGPFAFVYFDRAHGRVYFGRDRLGRRSLLVREDGRGVVLSSVADSIDPLWREVEADGIYVLDLGGGESLGESAGMMSAVTRLDWLEGEDAVDYVSMPLRRALCIVHC